jgi:hypothetical protein
VIVATRSAYVVTSCQLHCFLLDKPFERNIYGRRFIWCHRHAQHWAEIQQWQQRIYRPHHY